LAQLAVPMSDAETEEKANQAGDGAGRTNGGAVPDLLQMPDKRGGTRKKAASEIGREKTVRSEKRLAGASKREKDIHVADDV